LKHLLCGAALLLAAAIPGIARAETTTPPVATIPAASVHLEAAAIVEPPDGTQLPLNMPFVDEAGKSVVLGDYFKPGRPVLLALMYYRCPGLCSELLNQLTQAVPQMQLKAGAQFDVVLISIDPREKPDVASAKKQTYMDLMGNAAVPSGWHLLLSPDNQVRDLADLIGFGYKLNPVNDQYMHATAVYIVMPSGKISRVMANALVFDPAVLDDSLTNASDGKIGSTLFSFARTCGFVTFNHLTGKYEAVARNIMRAAAALTVLALGLTIGTFLYRDGRKRRRIAAAA
jgi:protein SCO1/2